MPQGMQIAKRARYALPTPRRVLSVERHIHTYQNSTAVSSSGNSNDTTVIPQDTTIGGRNGNKLLITKIRVSYAFIGVDSTNVVRFLLVRDKRANGGIAQLSDVLELSGAGSTPTVYSAINETNKERFEILYDRTMSLQTVGPIIENHVKTLNLSRKVVYPSASTTTALEGVILAMQISDSSVVSHPTCNFEVDIYFQP